MNIFMSWCVKKSFRQKVAIASEYSKQSVILKKIKVRNNSHTSILILVLVLNTIK